MTASRPLFWTTSACGHCHDDAQAVPLPVGDIEMARLRHISLTSSYQGHIGAYLVVGGVDATGPHLFTVHAHGSTDKLPYVTMGSGSLNAMAVFEANYKENMTVST